MKKKIEDKILKLEVIYPKEYKGGLCTFEIEGHVRIEQKLLIVKPMIAFQKPPNGLYKGTLTVSKDGFEDLKHLIEIKSCLKIEC